MVSWIQRILVPLLFSLLLPVVSHATTRYVAHGGSGNCTTGQNSATPLGTIAAGVNCSSNSTGGDILYIRQGTYTEHVANSGSNTVNWPRGTSWSSGGYFLMTSYPDELATLLGQIDIHPTNTSNGVNPAYLHFDRMKFTMGSTGDAPGTVGEVVFYVSGVDHLKVTNSELCCANNQVIETDGADHTFQNNNIHHANVFLDTGFWQRCAGVIYPPPGINCSVGGYCFYGHPHDSLFDNNSWHECTGIAMHLYHGGGGHEIENVTVRNNTFYNNATTDGDRGTGIAVIVAWTGQNNLFYNNVFYDNVQTYTNANGIISDQNIGDRLYNNTFWNNTATPIYLYPGSAGVIVRNNILFANGGVPIDDGGCGGCTLTCAGFPTCNLTTDPSFASVTPGTSNFLRLSGTGAAIDTALCVPGVVDTDKDGVSRPRGAGCDIGAYEFGSVPPPTRLRFTTQPQTTPANQTMAAVVVQAEDASGNISSAFTGNVTVTLVGSTQVIPRTGWTIHFVDSCEP